MLNLSVYQSQCHGSCEKMLQVGWIEVDPRGAISHCEARFSLAVMSISTGNGKVCMGRLSAAMAIFTSLLSAHTHITCMSGLWAVEVALWAVGK